jgi:DNA-binding response OmpR family regulator
MTSLEHSPHHSEANSARVVVVDDNAPVRQMLALALETAGFAVCEASTEIELQRILAQTRPDALIIDLQRSEAEGLQVLARMRARPALRDIPILFLSGSDADDLERQAVHAGADWFGLRPLGMLELQSRVTELLVASPPATQRADHKRVG